MGCADTKARDLGHRRLAFISFHGPAFTTFLAVAAGKIPRVHFATLIHPNELCELHSRLCKGGDSKRGTKEISVSAGICSDWIGLVTS